VKLGPWQAQRKHPEIFRNDLPFVAILIEKGSIGKLVCEQRGFPSCHDKNYYCPSNFLQWVKTN